MFTAIAMALVVTLQGAEVSSGTAASPAASDPVKVMDQFRLPEGFKAELFAAEPLLAFGGGTGVSILRRGAGYSESFGLAG